VKVPSKWFPVHKKTQLFKRSKSIVSSLCGMCHIQSVACALRLYGTKKPTSDEFVYCCELEIASDLSYNGYQADKRLNEST
jgi:hypothetical protein